MTKRIQAVLFTLALTGGFAVMMAPAPVQADERGFCIGMMTEDNQVEWHCDGGLGGCSSADDCK